MDLFGVSIDPPTYAAITEPAQELIVLAREQHRAHIGKRLIADWVAAVEGRGPAFHFPSLSHPPGMLVRVRPDPCSITVQSESSGWAVQAQWVVDWLEVYSMPESNRTLFAAVYGSCFHSNGCIDPPEWRIATEADIILRVTAQLLG